LSELDIYLARHYQDAEQFAFSCGISTTKLCELIDQQLIPEPSYIVTEHSTLKSYVFGEMDASGSKPGQYFHPANRTWVALALTSNGLKSSNELKTRFLNNMRYELEQLNKTVFRLPDSFTDDGTPIPDGLASRTEPLWEHFLKGTFGLCIANPVTESEIARKEILQEKLSTVSENGTKSDFTESETDAVLSLIEEYTKASMPFSPIEYHRSSRKRLVEDLKNRLAKA
jgi:uncharacterized protein YgfB (UPF0149 family)